MASFTPKGLTGEQTLFDVTIPDYGNPPSPSNAHPAHLVLEPSDTLRFRDGFTKPRHYMLAADAPGGDLEIEPGRTTRVFHFANDGLTYADIETAESLSSGTVNAQWIIDQPTTGLSISPARYGETAGYPLLGTGESDTIWQDLRGRYLAASERQVAFWFLFKGGDTFRYPVEYAGSGDDISGESALHPIKFGAYGTGRPIIVRGEGQFAQSARAGISFYVRQGFDWRAGDDMQAGSTDQDARNYAMFDDFVVSKTPYKMQNWSIGWTKDNARNAFTYRKCIGFDVQRDVPLRFEDEIPPPGPPPYGTWSNPNADRIEPYYMVDTHYCLIINCYMDGNGWDFGKLPDRNGFRRDLGINETSDPELPLTNGQPPSAYSHNIYFNTGRHVSMIGTILTRASSAGIQSRPGGFQLLNIYGENSTAHQLSQDQLDPEQNTDRNYSELNCHVIMGAGCSIKMSDHNLFGSVSSPIFVQSNELTDQSNNVMREHIAAHCIDPNNPSEATAKLEFSQVTNNFRLDTEGTRAYFWDTGPDAVVKYNWLVDAHDYNTTGLSEAAMDAATLGAWLDDLQSAPLGTNSTYDFCDYLRTLGTEAGRQSFNIWNFLAPSYGFTPFTRAAAATLTFVPDPRGNGFRWDDPFNWTGNGWAGMVAGDSADLDGNFVMHYTDYCELSDLDLGANGTLEVWGGKTRVTGDLGGGGTIRTHAAGQVWLEGTTSAGSKLFDLKGGRLLIGAAIADHISISAQVDNSDIVTVGPKSHEVEVLIDEGHALTIGDGHTFTLSGPKIWAGFDGAAGGASSLTVASGGTLAFAAGGGVIPKVQEFYSGRYGLDANNRVRQPDVASTVTLASGATVTVDATGLSAGTYDLIDVDTLTDNGAALPSGVAVSGNKLVLTVS